MSLDSTISISITRATKTSSRKGFNNPLLGVSKVPAGWGTAKVRTFGSLKELTDLGFLTTDECYKMASALLAQSPSVKTFLVGKRSLPPTKSIKLTVTNATEGYKYSFYVNGTLIEYTVPAAQTTTQVATALELLIEAVTDITSSSSVNVITMGAPAGIIFDVSGWRGNSQVPGGDSGMLLEDATTDPGVATDLTAWRAASTNWYGVVFDSIGKLEQIAAATWAQSNGVLLCIDAADSEILDSGDTNDAASTSKAATIDRAAYFVGTESLLHRTAVAMLGNRLPRQPGSDTWKWKSLATISPSNLTEGEKTAIKAKNANTYSVMGGPSMIEDGKVASGEYADVIRFVDWLQAEMQSDILDTLANAEKIPFTDAGVDVVKGCVQGTLGRGVKVGGLDKSPEPSVEAPLVADISSGNRGNRILPDIAFLGRLAGAIHYVNVAGVLSV